MGVTVPVSTCVPPMVNDINANNINKSLTTRGPSVGTKLVLMGGKIINPAGANNIPPALSAPGRSSARNTKKSRDERAPDRPPQLEVAILSCEK